MLKALDYKMKYNKIIENLGDFLAGTEYGVKYHEFTEKFKEVSDRDKIHIVVAGDWSTGKSTLIKALTGDDSIGIDTDVKTNKACQYEYNGVCIIDTPGLNSGNEEHTKTAETEIENADRVIYCITSQQQFSPTTIKEFAEIVRKPNLKNNVILAVTKYGLEAMGGEKPWEVADGIENDLEEAGVLVGQYGGLCVFSAQRYIDGIKSGDEDMVEASYFKEFMDLLEGFAPNMEENLSCMKCRRQGQLIEKFISEIINEMTGKYSDEERNELIKKRKDLQQKIADSKKQTVNIFHKSIIRLVDVAREACRDIEMDECDIKEKIDGEMTCCLMDLNNFMEESFSQIEGGISGIVKINETVSLPVKMDSEKKMINPFKGNEKFFGSLFRKAGSAIEKTNELAKPVIEKKKGFLGIKKKVMSEAGGKETALYNELIKISPKHGEEISVKLGRLSGKMASCVKFLEAAGAALDVGISVGNSIKEQYDGKKARERRSIFRNKLRTAMLEMEKEVKKEIEDKFDEKSKMVDEAYTVADGPDGRLLSGLQGQLNELRKMTGDFQ